MNCQQKINKIAHYCNFSRFFFKPCVKEVTVAAVLSFSSTYSRSLDQGITFFLLFVLQSSISNAICDLVLQLFRKSINMSFRQNGTISFQYFNIVSEVHGSTLPSIGSQFIFLKLDGVIRSRGGTTRKITILFNSCYKQQQNCQNLALLSVTKLVSFLCRTLYICPFS